jgi:hypothetical protein
VTEHQRSRTARQYPDAMEIEVHQRGGVLGMDRRYLVRDGTIEVIDKGQSRGATELEPGQAARIDELAAAAAGAEAMRAEDGFVSDDLETAIVVKGDDRRESTLNLRSGDDAPPEVWELVGEVSRASGV